MGEDGLQEDCFEEEVIYVLQFTYYNLRFEHPIVNCKL